MPSVDLLFPMIGSRIPTDHCYSLYSALSRLLPRLHSGEVPFSLAPITGHYAGNGQLMLDPRYSHLRLRLPVEHIPDVLPLAGKSLHLMGEAVQVGAPHVRAILPVNSLFSHAVTFKHATEEAAFQNAARRKLDDLGVAGRLELPRVPFGVRQGEPRRHVMRIKERAIICFGLLIHDLTPTESLLLQEKGLGGRRRMGAGLFLPATEAELL
jgi:CRISPR-associated protein Cas6